MINLLLVGISIILSIILIILLFYIKQLKSEQSEDNEREPLLQKYNNISISEEILSRFGSKKPRIQKSREVANNFNSGEKIEDAISILDKIDKEEILIVNQLSQYCQSFNEQRLLDSDLIDKNKASSSNYIEQKNQDPINLSQIQSNILSKSYGKSVPKNNTLDILKFKIYQQELEKKKRDKSVYSNLLNQYDSTFDNSNNSHQDISNESHHQFLKNKINNDEAKFGSFADHYISIDEQSQQLGSSNTSKYINKPPLYSVSMMSSSITSNVNNIKKSFNRSFNRIRINTNAKTNNILTKNNTILSQENSINNENYNTPANENVNGNNMNDKVRESEFDNGNNISYSNGSNRRHSNTYSEQSNHQDTDSLKSPISNDGSAITGLSSPSAVLTSPKIFKDMSSLSIIVPRDIDDSMVLDVKQEQQMMNSQIPKDIPNSNIEDFNEATHPLDNRQSILNNNNVNNSIINNSSLFPDITHDLSINNNIIEPADDEEDDASINYSHSSLIGRRRSLDYSSKRISRSSLGISSADKNIVSSSLFTSSLPPISRPTRIQSLPKLKRNSTDSNIQGKKTMAKAQDYIALSQRSFPVRANFIPDIYYDDEIKLNVGDLVVITDVYLDEWAKGINIMTNSSGVFPLCYLNTDEPQAQAKTKRFTKIINQEINNV
eukprot:jgi/Orpsp1_1/1178033/evm.model.c7180000063787.1